MNIFLPYENDVEKSVASLDNLRLNKQACEIEELLMMAEKESEGIELNSKGHSHHPVYLFYKNNPKFLAYYGYMCCREYFYRFGKYTKSIYYFDDILDKYGMFQYDEDCFITAMEIPSFTPYYMEGSKTDPNCIRTTNNVSQLFRDKLCKKWDNDKAKGRPPKWTKRGKPEFYKEK